MSLTITERGYYLTASRGLDLQNELIRHDLDHPFERPQSSVGLIVSALSLRRDRGLLPFTVLSCDNLPGNGHITRSMVIGFVHARGDDELTRWVENLCRFPSTMVDR